MKNRKFRKAFTLVELIVVIAIVAVLAAVSVVSYMAFVRQANESADIQLVKQLNTALQGDETLNGKRSTMHEMLGAMEDNGFVVENLTKTKSGYDIVWDQENNKFALLDGEKLVYGEDSFNKVEKYNKWKFADNVKEAEKQQYSVYLTKDFKTEKDILEISAGLDVGNHAELSKIDYKNNNSEQKVVIRTNGGTLTVGAEGNVAQGQIYHYGVLKDTTIYTESKCFHTYGAIGNMNLKAGKAIAEGNALIYLVTATTSVEIEEKDNGKFFIPAGTTQAEDGTGVPVSVAAQVNITPVEENTSYTYTDATKTGGNVYGIGNLAALEQFRDLVNVGFNFDGISVKLTSDITLNDGWTPIGEGSRKAAINTTVGSEGWIYSGNVYKGEFDGNNHKVYNLNNKGYVPSTNSLGNDGTNKIYCYGFFSLVAGNAYIHDLELVNVDIDTSRYASSTDNIKGDCVAALVGFSAGSLHIDNVKVTGNSTIIGYSAVSSIVAKVYNQDKDFANKENYPDITLENCSSNATVKITSAHYVTGLFGAIEYYNETKGVWLKSLKINFNTFTGTILAPENKSDNNNAGIAIVNVKSTSAEDMSKFIHNGNQNTGTQKYGKDEGEKTIDNCLFVDMSTNTPLESTRNSD